MEVMPKASVQLFQGNRLANSGSRRCGSNGTAKLPGIHGLGGIRSRYQPASPEYPSMPMGERPTTPYKNQKVSGEIDTTTDFIPAEWEPQPHLDAVDIGDL
jgi:hypothetical protein